MKITTKISAMAMLIAPMALGVASCAEVEEESEYVNWEKRNQAFIDSIAKVCSTNADGKWAKIVAYNINDSVESLKPNANHYIYIHKECEGNGTYKPLFKDSIRVHYLGRLLPSKSYKDGIVFDKSYSSYTLNEKTDVPTIMSPAGLTTGFATAVMHMVEGDEWKMYIPSYLGYGETTSATIPAHSTLIFDVKLARIYKFGIDTNTSWY